MIVSLIGMSGAGKTYWSKKLADQGFLYIGCDDLIEQKLASELKESGYKGISDVAKWLGHPYEKQFKKNQNKYLVRETEALEGIISLLEKRHVDKLVIDTTGSFVYVGDEICQKLRKYTIMVYLEISPSLQEEMLKLYLADPKPVIWADKFDSQKNETNKQALQRCYPDLLQHRAQLYKQYADIVLDYRELQLNSFTVNDFMSAILS